MTATLRSFFCLALAVTGLNSTFAQGIILEGNSLSNRYYNSDVVQGDTVFAVDFTVTNAGTLQDIVSWGEDSGAGIPGVPERYRVAIQLTLTTPGCDAQSHIVAQIENRLAAFERVSRTEVELVWQPAWTAERISPECRNRLGIDGRNQFHLSRKNDLVQLR